MPPSRSDWAAAYAAQSKSDFAVYEVLSIQRDIPTSHTLHYLQMACEKIAKAHLFRDTGTAEKKLRTRHVAFASFVKAFFISPAMRSRYVGKDAQLLGISVRANQIAREIERLAPVVDEEKSPGNAEYPWQSNGGIIVPCQYEFPNLSVLRNDAGINFLKTVKEAIVDFDRLAIR